MRQVAERAHAMSLTRDDIIRIATEHGAVHYGDPIGQMLFGTFDVDVEELVKAAYAAGQEAERDKAAAALVAEGVSEYERGLKDGAVLERNALLSEIETGIWIDKTTDEVLAELADTIRARGEKGGV